FDCGRRSGCSEVDPAGSCACGFTILEAGGGEEALAVAAGYEGKIDVAIVDFVMPGLNGLDLALQMEREFPALKTLYVSSAIESIGIVSMLRHAPKRVLLKPFTAHQLIQPVTALAQYRARRASRQLSRGFLERGFEVFLADIGADEELLARAGAEGDGFPAVLGRHGHSH